MLREALLIAIPVVAGLLSALVGMRQVHSLREKTGDKSLLTSILSFDFEGRPTAAKKRAENG